MPVRTRAQTRGPPLPTTAFTSAQRMQVYFFAQFLSVGMINAFAGIWFDSIGLTPFQIGIIGAVPVLIPLMITLFVGKLADKAGDWREVIIIGAVAAGLFPIGLFFVGGFWGVLVVWTLLATAQRVVVPVADAAAMRMSRRGGVDFGKLRGLSTIGYLLVIMVAGYALKDMGVAAFLPIFVTLGLVRLFASFGLPKMRDGSDRAARTAKLSGVLKPWFVLPLVAWALIDSNHIILNSFQGLLWAKQGISTEVIGLLIALGAIAETIMFFGFRRVARRFSPLTLLTGAAFFSIVRWCAMAQAPDVPWLIMLQMMHALTYAMGFLACTNFIADNTSEDIAAEAQSLLVTIELGMTAVALVVFGWLAGLYGPLAYYAAGVTATLGGIVIIYARRLKPV